MLKFVCDRDTILRELSAIQKVVSVRHSMTILSNVVLKTSNDFLVLHASDTKVRFETKVPVKVLIEGKVAVAADKYFDVVKSLPNCEIEVSVQEDKLVIIPTKHENLRIQLRCQSSDGFPFLDVPESNVSFQISQKDFIHMITQTFFAVSKDETRIFMNGVFFSKNR